MTSVKPGAIVARGTHNNGRLRFGMSISLPNFSLSAAHQTLSPKEWNQTLLRLTLQLNSILNDDLHIVEDTFVPELCTFLDSFVKDAAVDKLNNVAALTSSKTIRAQVLKLLEQMSKRKPGEMDINMLKHIAIVFDRHDDRETVRTIFQRVMQADPVALGAEGAGPMVDLRDRIVPAFASIAGQPFVAGTDDPEHYIKSSGILAVTVMKLLKLDLPEVTLPFFLDQSFSLAIAKCYDDGLRSAAKVKGGYSLELDVEADQRWQIDWMLAKIELTGILRLILNHGVKAVKDPPPTFKAIASSTYKNVLFDALLALIDHSKRTIQANTKGRPTKWLVEKALMEDFQQVGNLSKYLKDNFPSERDPRLARIFDGLKELSNGIAEGDVLGGVAFLLHFQNTIAQRALKGKGKEVYPDPPLEDMSQDIAVTQVLDIFPTEDGSFIRTALQHSAINGSVDTLIAMLLEDSLPADLSSIREGSSPTPPVIRDEAPAPSYERRNVFDDDELDFSRLRIGKNRAEDADTLLQDKAQVADLKADILRRAAEVSDEEDEEFEISAPDQRRARRVPFDDEPFLDEAIDVGPRVKIGGGEGEDIDDEEDEVEPQQNVETILELAYIRDPKLFDRDQATRRSKPRADLKAQTGWADEQIEGWRIMLERNPRKDKILAKHAFSGNKPLPGVRPKKYDEGEESGSGREGPTQSTRGQQRGRGRGRGSGGGSGRGGPSGRGRGRGGGEGGSDQTARDRAWKEKNKSRVRQRGNDHKMAKTGP